METVHLTDTDIDQYLAGEKNESDATTIRLHWFNCPSCQTRIESRLQNKEDVFVLGEPNHGEKVRGERWPVIFHSFRLSNSLFLLSEDVQGCVFLEAFLTPCPSYITIGQDRYEVKKMKKGLYELLGAGIADVQDCFWDHRDDFAEQFVTIS